MTAEQLAAVISVVETGSFSASARKLGTAQSTVSRRVMQVENELGIRMFDRSGEQVSLSRDGEAIFPRTVRLAGIYERIAELSGRRGIKSADMRINIDQMRSVAAVAETLSFSAAAEKLNFSQAAVSKHVRAFEEQTGKQLFQRRNGSKVCADPPAEDMIKEVEAALACYKRMCGRTAELAAKSEQSITVGVVRHLCNDAENAITADFCIEHPEIGVTQLVAPLETLKDMLADGRVDALLFKHPRSLLPEREDGRPRQFFEMNIDSGLFSVQLLREKLYVAIAETNALARRTELGLRDLVGEKLVFTDGAVRRKRAFAMFMEACEREKAFPGIYEKDNLTPGALMLLVSRGTAAALTMGKPRAVYPGVVFIPVARPWLEPCVTLCVRSGGTRALEAFVDYATGWSGAEKI